MSKFQIIQADPAQFKEQIIDFWSKYLPGTLPARFEWLSDGNPAGPAVWFFAIDDKNELAGMVSITPRNVVMNSKPMRAGILGDYIINGKYRVFGPNLLLLKSALASMIGLNLNFIYTVPNAQSELIIKRVSAHKVGCFKNFVKPLNAKHYLSKYVGSSSQGLIAPFVNAALAMISRETYTLSRSVLGECTVFDESFDTLWEGVKKRFNMAGDHGSAFLTWKYLKNPLHRFRMLTLKERTDGSPKGFIIFNVEKSRLNIHDVMAIDKTSVSELLKGLVLMGRRENCISVNIEIFDTNPLLSALKSFGFFDAKTDFGVFYIGEEHWPDNDCYLFWGDRNL
jgi:hypothetical protein